MRLTGPCSASHAITTGVGLLVGLIPAVVHSSRARVHSSMQSGSRRVAGRQSWTSATLAVAEVALALVLLVGAGLLLRSVHKLFAVPPGFEPAHLLTLQVQASGARFRNPQTAHRFFADALEQVRRTPGVAAAAWTSQLPLSGDSAVRRPVRVDSQRQPGGGPRRVSLRGQPRLLRDAAHPAGARPRFTITTTPGRLRRGPQ